MANVEPGKVPIIESMTTAWRFFLANWLHFTPAAAVMGLAAGVQELLQPSAGIDAQTVNMAAVLAASCIGFLADIVFSASVLRKAIHNQSSGLFGLEFGADEMRLGGVIISLGLLFVPIGVLVLGVMTVFAIGHLASTPEEAMKILSDPTAFSDAVTKRLGDGGALALSLFILAMLAVFVWVGVRLWLTSAGTIGERRMVVFQTWKWTHGNFWRVFAAIVITSFPVVLAANFLIGLVQLPVSSQGATAAIPVVERFVIAAVVGLITTLSKIPTLALGAHLYKGLRPPDFVAK